MKKAKKTLLNFTASTTTVGVVNVTRESFLQCLMKNLIEAKNNRPQLYDWKEVDIFTVFKRFTESLESDTYSRHCEAIKNTCRELKMKDDRISINAIFKGEK